MPRLRFSGPAYLRLSSFAALNAIAIKTYVRHFVGKKLDPAWDTNMEIGVRFWRRQFTLAMNAPDIRLGREILDCVQTETPDIYEVDEVSHRTPLGTWYLPHHRKTAATLLYFHGGGYAFYGAMTRRFGAMLAHHTGAPVFAPDYRLTPENPHPAQAEDAMAAWEYVTTSASPKQLVVVGDSAGGHMMLSLLIALRETGLEQPSLGIGLCPWTDIGERGASLYGNDPTDLVQGWMAMQFGRWLDPDGFHGRDTLSPIAHDFSDCAPLYLQAGGNEILHDMIQDFAERQQELGARVLFDAWPSMPHDFQAMDCTQQAAVEANGRIAAAVHYAMGEEPRFGIDEMTKTASISFWGTH